jgi:two-component system response regulator
MARYISDNRRITSILAKALDMKGAGLQKVVVLVEDNADDEQLTLRAMNQTDHGAFVHVARDGEEALRTLLGFAEDQLPDLVLLDLKLPKVSGLEVLRQLRENHLTCELPVVVLTSSDEERDIAEAYRLGANSYVRKPVDYDEFMDSVRQLGAYWLGVNRARGATS